MQPTLVVVGALARIEVGQRADVCASLRAIQGVETFDLEEAEKLGILIESESLDAAHQILCKQVAKVEGVLATWPVSVEMDEDLDGLDPRIGSCSPGEE